MVKQITSVARQSNIELLRIVAMLLVLIVHANFYSLGWPTIDDLKSDPSASYIGFFIQSCTVVCVNLFILVSGYFSITWKLKGFLNFIFQCLFLYFGIYFLFLVTGLAPLTLRNISMCLFASGYSWFILAYIGLYLLAPALNAFIEKATHWQLGFFILAFYLFQFVYGWLFGTSADFLRGYSILSFVGLYMIGRYLKLYPSRLFSLNKYWYLGAFFLIVFMGLGVLFVVGTRIGNAHLFRFTVDHLYGYNAPNVMACSILLFLFFLQFKFQSRLVNWVAGSALAVYLIHVNTFVTPYYTELVQYLHTELAPPLVFRGVLFCVISVIFVGCILVDKIRVFCWGRVWPLIEKVAGRIQARGSVRHPSR